jgi:hypothetical protein
VLDKLHPVAALIPLNRPTVPSGQNTTTVDATNNVERTGAELVSAAQLASSGNFVSVKSVELLTGLAASAVTSSAGAQARDAASSAASKEADANSLLTKLGNSLGTTATAVKWALVVAVLVAAAYFARTFKSRS